MALWELQSQLLRPITFFSTWHTISVEYSKNLLMLARIEKKTIDTQMESDFLLDVSICGLRMQLSLSTAMARMVKLDPVRDIWASGSSQGTRRGWIWKETITMRVRANSYCREGFIWLALVLESILWTKCIIEWPLSLLQTVQTQFCNGTKQLRSKILQSLASCIVIGRNMWSYHHAHE